MQSSERTIRVWPALLLFLLATAGETTEAPPSGVGPDSGAADCVIVLHGLARTSTSMRVLARRIAAAGYRVENVGYPSRKQSVEQLAAATVPKGLARCGDAPRVHFVTHSMGGILLRQHLATVGIERLGRTVMLAPPNRGSEVVDKLADVPGFAFWNGPAGDQLGTGPDSLPNRLGRFPGELGIIAGERSINPILSGLIPGPDDGKVAVSRTQVDGMNSFIVLPYTHTFMMRAEPVIAQTLYFLRHGRFEN